MSRRYSGKKGKSGSKRPLKKTHPSWIRYKPKEVEMLIIKMAKEGKSPSQIGLILRDTYGIPLVKNIINKRITKVLEENNIISKIPEDVTALIKRSMFVKKHIEINKNDEVAKRGITLIESKIKRLVKFYKMTGRMPEDWKYEPDKVRMYLE